VIASRCGLLLDEVLHGAARCAHRARLLARFSEIAAPGKGAPIILAALARLGTTACHWIDGELRIEISGDATQSKISASTTLGGGFREKLFADTVLRVPLEEFSRGISRAPKLIQPLQVKETGKRIVLSVTQEVRRTSLPPPMVTIDPESLMAVPRLVMPHGLEQAEIRAPQALAAQRSVARPAAAPEAPKVVLRRRTKDDPPPK
jgi:hypothetical protein